MTTNEFLATLDLAQLDYAKCRAEELIKVKREEDMIPLWVVADEDINYAWFAECDYEKAVGRLCEEIQRESKDRRGNLRFEVMKRRYRESDVAELLTS